MNTNNIVKLNLIKKFFNILDKLFTNYTSF